MRFFNFKKNKINEIKEEINDSKEISENIDINASKIKKFNLLCINFGVNDYFFTLTANSSGKITINKSLSKNTLNDPKKIMYIYELIDKNLNNFTKLNSKKVSKNESNNMIQLDINNEKYVVFRNEEDREKLKFYDTFMLGIVDILNLKKTYENIELDLMFDYSSNWNSVSLDLTDSFLLSNSKQLLNFKDKDNNYITFEYIALRNNIVSKIINNIYDSEEYKVLTTINYTNNICKSEFLVVEYGDKIELFSFISLSSICLIITSTVGEKENFEINDIDSNQKYKDILECINSFKILTSEYN